MRKWRPTRHNSAETGLVCNLNRSLAQGGGNMSNVGRVSTVLTCAFFIGCGHSLTLSVADDAGTESSQSSTLGADAGTGTPDGGDGGGGAELRQAGAQCKTSAQCQTGCCMSVDFEDYCMTKPMVEDLGIPWDPRDCE
jgi:hypothetical protein